MILWALRRGRGRRDQFLMHPQREDAMRPANDLNDHLSGWILHEEDNGDSDENRATETPNG